MTVDWVGPGKIVSDDGTDVSPTSSATLATNLDFTIERTVSVGDVVKATTKAAAFDTTTLIGEPFDLTSTINNIYINMLILGNPNTLGNGGFAIVVEDSTDTDSIGTWFVGPRPGFIGGWVAYVIHPSKDFNNVTAGTAGWTITGNPGQLTGIDAVGGEWDVLNSIMGNFDNCFIDGVALGSGYEWTGTGGVFSDFSDFEEQPDGRFGGLFSQSGVIFCQCQLTLGDIVGTVTTTFIDDGFTVVWTDVQTDTESAVEATFYEMNFTEIGGGSTTVTLSNGNFLAESPQEVYCNFAGVSTGSVTLNNVNVDRARLVDLDSGVTWTLGNITNSGRIDLGGQPTLTDISIIDPTAGLAMEINAENEVANLSNISFDGAGVGGDGSGGLFINITGAGPFTLTFDNVTFANRVASSHDIVVAKNSDADYTLNIGGSPTVNNLGTGTVTVVDNITLTVTASDSAGVKIPGVSVQFFETDGSGQIGADQITDEDGVASVATDSGARNVIAIIRQSANTAQVTSRSVDQLTTTDPHKFHTGDGVVWDETNGSMAELTDGVTYFVEVISASVVEMYTTAALAIAAAGGITLGALTDNPELNPIRYINNSATLIITGSDIGASITMVTDTIAKDTI